MYVTCSSQCGLGNLWSQCGFGFLYMSYIRSVSIGLSVDVVNQVGVDWVGFACHTSGHCGLGCLFTSYIRSVWIGWSVHVTCLMSVDWVVCTCNMSKSNMVIVLSVHDTIYNWHLLISLVFSVFCRRILVHLNNRLKITSMETFAAAQVT